MSQSGQEGVPADGAQQGQQQNGTGTDSAQGTGNGGGTSADSAQQNGGNNTDSNNTVSREDFDRLQRQLSEADKKRTQAEQELQSIKDKDLSESEKTKKDLQTITAERDTLLGEVNNLRLANAFLSVNTISWQNAEVALDIASSKGYLENVVDQDGKVDSKAMEAALKKLSEDHKYLVKVQDSEEEEQTPPSGSPASGAGKTKQDDKVRMERLKATLPALGRR